MIPGEPYTPAMITGLLRAMPADRLASILPTAFHAWPVRRIVPGKIIRELIDNEISRRRRLA
jgi:hypothetical protein